MKISIYKKKEIVVKVVDFRLYRKSKNTLK